MSEQVQVPTIAQQEPEKVGNLISVKAPIKHTATTPSIFLAGSIEMGKATEWQTRFTEALSDLDITVFNPRRNDWDSSWKQEIGFAPFREQVEWEMDRLEEADIIVLNFEWNTQSPISLLELGLHANSKKVIVCCPSAFWRSGNVHIVCARYGLEMVQTLEELQDKARVALEKLIKERE